MATSFLFFLLSAAFLLLFVYPYVIYPQLLRFLAKKPYLAKENEDVSNTSVALLFCAYNEEQALPEKIRNVRMLKQLYPDMEVLAYSDCSEDRTNQILRDADDVLVPVIGDIRVGKVVGMQKLVAMTKKDIIVFTDANVMLEPDSVPRMLRYFNNPNIGTVAGTLIYVNSDSDSDTPPTARIGGLYWRLEEYIKRNESETGSTMGADGALFARRREGYPRLPGELVDDLAASISVLFEGRRCISAPDVHAYEQSVGNSAEEFLRKRRIACGSMSTYRYLLPKLRSLSWIDRFKFFSHKTLRWWGGFHLLFAISFAILGGWFAGFPVVSISSISGGALLLWLFGTKGIPIFSSVYEILLAIVATGIGVVESMIGKRYQTWTPAKSR